jgi:predicted metal-dependent peptidase
LHNACAHHVRRGDRKPNLWNRAADYAVNQILEDCKIALPPERLLDPAFKDMSADTIYNRLPDPPEDSGSDPGGCGEVRDAEGKDGQQPSPAELTQAEQQWKVAVAQAAQQAKSMGDLPAGLDRFVEDILEPKIDWREILRRFVDQTARSDYSWFPPNRRYIHQGLYLPSLKSEELPPIVIAVDTSGSIREDDIKQFVGEMTAILEDYETSCTVIYCDTKVTNVEEFTSDDLPLQLHPKGGGCTDFRPPISHIEEHNIQPSCLIYLTDLCCSRYPDEPEYPVLWAHIGAYGGNPPFGEIIKL